MNDPLPQGSMLQRFRTTTIIWFAMLFSVLLYAGLVEAFHRGLIVRSVPAELPNGDRIHLILLGLAVLTFFMAGTIKTMLLRGLDVVPRPSAAEAAQKLQTATIVTAAISESVAIMGFVEYMLLNRYGSFYLFIGLAMLGFLVHAPKVSQWMRYAGSSSSLENGS